MDDFESIQDLLQETGYSVSEVHSILVAHVCFGLPLESMDKIFSQEGDEARGEIRLSLAKLYETIDGQLQQEDFSFQLLLGSDENDLGSKIEAMRLWCQAFLMVIQLNHINCDSLLTEDANEALTFFKHVIELEEVGDHPTDEDEKDFFEVEEYIRVAVMLIYTEMRMQEPNDSEQTIH